MADHSDRGHSGPDDISSEESEKPHRLAVSDKKIRTFYLEVSRRRGRPKAKFAAARKLLINCYIMLRDGISYEEFRRRGEVGLYEGSGKLGIKDAADPGRPDGMASHFRVVENEPIQISCSGHEEMMGSPKHGVSDI